MMRRIHDGGENLAGGSKAGRVCRRERRQVDKQQLTTSNEKPLAEKFCDNDWSDMLGHVGRGQICAK